MRIDTVRLGIGQGEDRADATLNSLRYSKEDLISLIRDADDIVIKPNLVHVGCSDACTSSIILRTMIDLFPEITEKRLRIAEGSSIGSTSEGFKKMGYTELVRDYGLELIDLNNDAYRSLEIYNSKRERVTVRASLTLLDSDLRISICPAKTHDTVVLTLSIKNCCVGALVGEDKMMVHQGYPMINLNLALLAKKLFPHFSVVDAYSPMQGNGPTDGSCVQRGIVISGIDALAVDSTSSRLLGFDPEKIGYLHYCNLMGMGVMDEELIALTGPVKPINIVPLKPHSSFKRQLAWKFDDDFAYRVLGIEQ